MKDYMILIFPEGNPVEEKTGESHRGDIKDIGQYLERLSLQGHLKEAQPLEPGAVTIRGTEGNFEVTSLPPNQVDIAGYYMITADNMQQAVNIAQGDPRFGDGAWRMEIRAVMQMGGIPDEGAILDNSL
ncbi:YciI family protein [Persicobacter psychrovividus]|uniref:YCII-related domain-containing protein n=1 Tax=Persicobacter psychrovividus TaxID=387638 RepID=A0ABN6LAR2_9BACT|nr:hypothetical protein PEPS_07970 [Persicobacter psychrovividus]